MSDFQAKAVKFVGQHDSFATPAPCGGVWIYSTFIDMLPERVAATGRRIDCERNLATTFAEVRAILGY